MVAERAVSSFDHRHRFVGNLTYALPEGVLASGWRVNGIVTLQSGAPFTVNLGTVRANIGHVPRSVPMRSAIRMPQRRTLASNGSTGAVSCCRPSSRLVIQGGTPCWRQVMR